MTLYQKLHSLFQQKHPEYIDSVSTVSGELFLSGAISVLEILADLPAGEKSFLEDSDYLDELQRLVFKHNNSTITVQDRIRRTIEAAAQAKIDEEFKETEKQKARLEFCDNWIDSIHETYFQPLGFPRSCVTHIPAQCAESLHFVLAVPFEEKQLELSFYTTSSLFHNERLGWYANNADSIYFKARDTSYQKNELELKHFSIGLFSELAALAQEPSLDKIPDEF